MKEIIKKAVPFKLIDVIVSPIVFISSIFLKIVRTIGLQRMPVSRIIFHTIGILPIRDHYYEPLFQPKYIEDKSWSDRDLPSLDFNIQEQLKLLNNFKFNDELNNIAIHQSDPLEYYYMNNFFGPGDSEIYYNLIRALKPSKIIEIGSGFSTLMAIRAIRENRRSDSHYDCVLSCIEPYEKPWLEKTDAVIVRNTVENVDIAHFESLGRNDILFIDSSHVIRPQGDVLTEYFKILPILKPEVYIHIHDIFSPKDYPNEWLFETVRLWNEQYLLESFLSFNNNFKIVASLNYLKHHYFNELSAVCPTLRKFSTIEPASFWIKKVK